MSNIELLSAAFSAMLGVKVVPLTKVSEGQAGSASKKMKKVSVYQLFRATHYIGSMHSDLSGVFVPEMEGSADQEFEINVRTLTGTKIPISVTKHHTIAQVKEAIKAKHDIPIANQGLLFNSNILQDDATIGSIGMKPHLVCNLILIDGEDVTETEFGLEEDDLAPEYDYDFTHVQDSEKFYRGGLEYTRPCGWMRFALRVKGRSEYHGNDTWIGPPGYRTESAPGEWPVSYHGTSAEACGGIQKDGYDPKKSNRQLFGPGIYYSPDLQKVSEYRYTQKFECHGKYYEVALQNRVNPEKKGYQDKKDPGNPDRFRDCSMVIISPSISPFQYWRCPRQDPDEGIYDIRPYGILIRKI